MPRCIATKRVYAVHVTGPEQWRSSSPTKESPDLRQLTQQRPPRLGSQRDELRRRPARQPPSCDLVQNGQEQHPRAKRPGQYYPTDVATSDPPASIGFQPCCAASATPYAADSLLGMVRRLKQLRYKLVPLSKSVSFTDDAEPVEVILNGFRCTATSSGLVAEPVDELEFEDELESEYEAEAVSTLQPALEAWSATSELIDRSPVAFEYVGTSTEPVQPEGGTGVTAQVLHETMVFTDAVAVVKNNLPAPHPHICFEGAVPAQLRRRWRNVEQGKESPVMVAYLVQTTVEQYVHGEDKVSDTLNISSKVWSRLHKLASSDDPDHGRRLAAALFL